MNENLSLFPANEDLFAETPVLGDPESARDRSGTEVGPGLFLLATTAVKNSCLVMRIAALRTAGPSRRLPHILLSSAMGPQTRSV